MCRFACKEDEVVVSNSFQKMMPLGVQLKLGRSNSPRGDAQTEDGRLYGENCKFYTGNEDYEQNNYQGSCTNMV